MDGSRGNATGSRAPCCTMAAASDLLISDKNKIKSGLGNDQGVGKLTM